MCNPRLIFTDTLNMLLKREKCRKEKQQQQMLSVEVILHVTDTWIFIMLGR